MPAGFSRPTLSGPRRRHPESDFRGKHDWIFSASRPNGSDGAGELEVYRHHQKCADPGGSDRTLFDGGGVRESVQCPGPAEKNPDGIDRRNMRAADRKIRRKYRASFEVHQGEKSREGAEDAERERSAGTE